jgi:hypothetical protein
MVGPLVRAEGFVAPCIPSLAHKPSFGPYWVHEIKHDGYRLIVRRDGPAVRLFTRRGHDWSDRARCAGDSCGKNRPASGLPPGGNDTLRGKARKGSVDTLTILPNTIRLVGEDFWAKAMLKSKIRVHGRQSWIPMDLAEGGS